ncbi:MAG: hypothetical protein V3R37_07530 [Rhodospirillales bacterium]
MTFQSRLRGAFRMLVVGLLFCGLLYAHAVQAGGSFGNSSLKGTYTYTNNTDGIGGAGLITFDGNGKVDLAIKVNVPKKNGGRKIVSLSGSGNYSVDTSGAGLVTIKTKGADGKEIKLAYDFIITKAVGALANEVFAILQSGGVQGQLVAPMWKRRG